MNDLNSILLEGVVSHLGEMTESGIFNFVTESKRYYKIDKEPACEVIPTHIRVCGELAENVTFLIEVGKKVRLVGRLENRSGKYMMKDFPNANCMFVEHIEFVLEKTITG